MKRNTTPTSVASKLLSALALVGLISATACDGQDASEPENADAALLFDLTEQQVEAIHAAYLPEEALAQTHARLTAPFDCDLYDDMCVQVGREAAIDLTSRQVDLALEGVSPEEMEVQLREWVDQATKDRADAEDVSGEDEFRSSGAWATRTKGDYRLRVRNGITTPLIGQRRAWTESKLQHKDIFGVWWSVVGTEVCTNAGVNEQVRVGGGGGGPTTYVTIESYDPAKTCQASTSSLTVTTYHARNNGWENAGLWAYYTLTADGCGTGEVNATNLGICAGSHTVVYY